MWAEEAFGAYGPLLLPLVIFVLSIVHAILGVGLLLFGTPTLMLLGLGFADTLAIVLPCSMVVNLCQLRSGLPADRAALTRFAGLTLPTLALGMLVALWGMSTRWTAVLVGCALLGVGVLRTSTGAMTWLTRVIVARRNGYLAGLGLIHGLSNMGGGLLVVYASAVSPDKEEMRRVVAMGYLMFEVVQLCTLAVVAPQHLASSQLHLAVLSFVAYWIGNFVFQGLSQERFRQIVTVLVFSYGLLTLGKAFAY
jgi:uncharacterized protein